MTTTLDPRLRLPIALLAVVQIALLVAALCDIRTRPAADVRGSRRAWAAASFVNFVGPIAYFAFGRRRAERVDGGARPSR